MKHWIIFLLSVICCLVGSAQQNGFLYEGTPFIDPDWGRSYKTAEQDRTLLRGVDSLMKLALKKVMESSGDYSATLTDMSFIFDPGVQKENSEKGSKCVTCIYSSSPEQGSHFSYENRIRLELQENTPTYRLKLQIDDSLNTIKQNDLLNKRKVAGSASKEAQIQKEMAEYQKEVEKLDLSKLDEKKLAEIEKKGAAIGKIAQANSDEQKLDENYYHDLFSIAYNPVCTVLLETNHPMYSEEKDLFMAMKNNPDYYFKQLSLPGCDLAFIYFDKYNKAEDLPHSDYPVMIAYGGPVYSSSTTLPRMWIKPFCVRFSFSGNITQIEEIISLIDFNYFSGILWTDL